MITLNDMIRDMDKSPEMLEERRKSKPYYEIATQIINARSELGMTRKELAKMCKIPVRNIRKLEVAEWENVRIKDLIKIAGALNLWLFIRIDEYQPPE